MVVRRLILAMGVVLAVLGFPAAGAQDDVTAAFVRLIDSSTPNQTLVNFLYNGEPGQVADAKVSANGEEVETSEIVPLERSTRAVYVIDTSVAMADANALEFVRQGLTDMAGELGDGEEVAIIAAATEPELIQTFTSDAAILAGSIEDITAVKPDEELNPAGTAAIWASVEYAADLLDNNEADQPNIVVVAGSDDPNGSFTRAKGAVSNSYAAVFSVNFTGAGYSGQPTASLSEEFGGEVINAGKAADIAPGIVAANATIGEQYQFTFSPGVDAGEVVELSIEIDGTSLPASYVVGTTVEGVPALNPTTTGSAPGIGALQGPLGLVLAVVFVLIAGGLLAYGLITVLMPEDSLSNVLEVYSEGFNPDDDDDEGMSLAKSAVIQRAVELTEQVADSQGYLARAEAALERANLPLRAGEAMFFYGATVIGVTLLALILSKSLVFGIVVGLIGALIPGAVVSFLAGRRRKKFLSQLPDTLQLLAGTLRAGYSLMQGVEAVSQEIDGPMGSELRRVVTEARLGRPLEESLDGTANRMNSEDFAWCVMAIQIQREVGGNLAELLLTVADTMTQRERLRRDVQSLTAEGRVSAVVLGILPVLLGIVMYVLNPAYIGKLFSDTLGNILLGGAIIAMGIGFFWMKKIIDIEI